MVIKFLKAGYPIDNQNVKGRSSTSSPYVKNLVTQTSEAKLLDASTISTMHGSSTYALIEYQKPSY